MKPYERIMKRSCVVCGQRLAIRLHKDRSYEGGYYFGITRVPVGDGKWETIRKGSKTKSGVVKWTGKEEKIEYWECEKCFHED